MSELATSFDDMAGRLESTVKAQREFVLNASQQPPSPLTGMKLRLESAIAQSEDVDLKRPLEAADMEVDRLAEIVERLLVMAGRIEQVGPAEVELSATVSRAVERLGRAVPDRSLNRVAQAWRRRRRRRRRRRALAPPQWFDDEASRQTHTSLARGQLTSSNSPLTPRASPAA